MDIQSAFHSHAGTCSDGSARTHAHAPSGLAAGQRLNVGCFDLWSLSVGHTQSNTLATLLPVVIKRSSPRHQEHRGREAQSSFKAAAFKGTLVKSYVHIVWGGVIYVQCYCSSLWSARSNQLFTHTTREEAATDLPTKSPPCTVFK